MEATARFEVLVIDRSHSGASFHSVCFTVRRPFGALLTALRHKQKTGFTPRDTYYLRATGNGWGLISLLRMK